MSEQFRTLIYPLGFVAQAFFFVRFFIQWVLSERAKKSYVTEIFWKLSISGSIILMLHAYIQGQFHLCLIQSTNLFISWRNLNLMQHSDKQYSLQTTLIMLSIAIAAPFIAFLIQSDGSSWFRIPTTPWQHNTIRQVPIFWHTLGSIGMLIFASRFWIQWVYAECKKRSQINALFWWLSLTGSILSLIYFIFIDDMINILSYCLGALPYIRNIIIIKKSKILSYE